MAFQNTPLQQRSWYGAMVAALGILASTGPALCEELDITKYKLTFSEEFDKLSVSAWGPAGPGGSRWIAHTPWAGDFGDARFADPKPGFPFTTKNGILSIEARKGDDGIWQSGLLASADPQGRGFHQKFGYFEMRAKLPPGAGLWSAFWLIANQDPDTSAEVDVLEHYGVAPDKYQAVPHVWAKTDKGKPYGEILTFDVPYGSLYADFHTYGVSIEEDWTTFYHDRKAMGRIKTPVEYHRPMFILLNLALGGGWPIDKTPNPSVMLVDYVKAYQLKAPEEGQPKPRLIPSAD